MTCPIHAVRPEHRELLFESRSSIDRQAQQTRAHVKVRQFRIAQLCATPHAACDVLCGNFDIILEPRLPLSSCGLGVFRHT